MLFCITIILLLNTEMISPSRFGLEVDIEMSLKLGRLILVISRLGYHNYFDQVPGNQLHNLKLIFDIIS